MQTQNGGSQKISAECHTTRVVKEICTERYFPLAKESKDHWKFLKLGRRAKRFFVEFGKDIPSKLGSSQRGPNCL